MDTPENPTRREFLQLAGRSAAAGIAIGATHAHADERPAVEQRADRRPSRVAVKLIVNGQARTLLVEPRTTLLDALRKELALTGTNAPHMTFAMSTAISRPRAC